MGYHKAIVVISGRAHWFFMIVYILRQSCFCETWAICVPWITYGYLYICLYYDMWYMTYMLQLTYIQITQVYTSYRTKRWFWEFFDIFWPYLARTSLLAWADKITRLPFTYLDSQLNKEWPAISDKNFETCTHSPLI